MKRALPFLLLLLFAATGCSSTRSAHVQEGSEPAAGAWTSRLIDPVSSPVTFASPLIHTSLNLIGLQQELPSDSVFSGGDVNVFAAQIRYAVNDRLALLATKDGYVDFNPDAGMDEEGLADIAFGFKYAVVADEERGLLVTPGLLFETKSGDEDVFQGNGSGAFRPFVSAGLDLGELNLIGATELHLPLDDDEETTLISYHAHADYEVTPELHPLVEVNGITYLKDGEALPFDFEGGDLINLGSADVDGNTVVTGAVGARYRLSENVWLGLVYELPLTSREDLFDSRITLDAVLLLL